MRQVSYLDYFSRIYKDEIKLEMAKRVPPEGLRRTGESGTLNLHRQVRTDLFEALSKEKQEEIKRGAEAETQARRQPPPEAEIYR